MTTANYREKMFSSPYHGQYYCSDWFLFDAMNSLYRCHLSTQSHYHQIQKYFFWNDFSLHTPFGLSSCRPSSRKNWDSSLSLNGRSTHANHSIARSIISPNFGTVPRSFLRSQYDQKNMQCQVKWRGFLFLLPVSVRGKTRVNFACASTDKLSITILQFA